MIKVISFDMDGTLINEDFDEAIWDEGLPRFYAEQKNISFEKAKKYCFKKYDEYLGTNEWTSLRFWFNLFGLKDWKGLIEKNIDKIKLYPESTEVLKELYKKYKLIVITQNPKEFFDIKLKGFEHYFNKIYSSTYHYKSLKKDEEVYKKIIKDLNIKPNEILHVGNHKEFDYDIPKSLGIKAILLDREGKYPDEETIKNLKELLDKLQ